ncbi:unnamed protein product [Schistosoma mattheei]|uniref:Uncharacterized protein n=1 Tax=Schistosoma mattheei TaxID=31246 RepID=A0A3P8G284_9TREM|nr:unnamed protein product [Schistosoma mattheei]
MSAQNTSHPFTRHYQQQPTVGENKSDPSGGGNQEEALEVDRTHIEESTELCHKASCHMESSRPKEEETLIVSSFGAILTWGRDTITRELDDVIGPMIKKMYGEEVAQDFTDMASGILQLTIRRL